MAAVPITILGMLYDKTKDEPPKQVTIVGVEWNPALSIGGGPVYPPPEKPPGGGEPPTIWPNPPEGIAPIPEHPIVIPPPPDVIPPDPQPPVHNGWNWSAAKSGWYFLYVPGAGAAQPKK